MAATAAAFAFSLHTKYNYGNITYVRGAASPPAVTGSFNYGRLLVLCPLLATSSAKNCTKMQLSSSSAGQTSAPNLVPKPLKNVQKLKETPLLWKNMPTTNLGKSCGFAIQNAINLPYKLCHESLVPFSHYLSLFYHI